MFYTTGYYRFPNNYFTFVELMINRVCLRRLLRGVKTGTSKKEPGNVDYNISELQYFKNLQPNLIN